MEVYLKKAQDMAMAQTDLTLVSGDPGDPSDPGDPGDR